MVSSVLFSCDYPFAGYLLSKDVYPLPIQKGEMRFSVPPVCPILNLKFVFLGIQILLFI